MFLGLIRAECWSDTIHGFSIADLRGLGQLGDRAAYNGSMGIRHGHVSLMALLGTGTLCIDHGREKSFTVSGGFLQVVDNTVTVLSESAAAA